MRLAVGAETYGLEGWGGMEVRCAERLGGLGVRGLRQQESKRFRS